MNMSAEYQAARREFYKNQKRCVRCMMQDDRTKDGNRLCTVCAADYVRRQRERWDAPETRARLLAGYRQKRDERRAAGLCTKCGKRAAAQGFTRCAECVEKTREAARRRRNREAVYAEKA